jgi:guanylate cyclase, other
MLSQFFFYFKVFQLQSVLFEIQLLRVTSAKIPSGSVEEKKETEIPSMPLDRRGSQGLRSILLKGEMRYLKGCEAIMFLCSPL